MLKRSQRTATKVGDELLLSTSLPTLQDFLTLLITRQVDRVTLDSTTTYCSKIINSNGSQFTVYTDDGIRKDHHRLAVVKRAKFHAARDSSAVPPSSRRQIQSLLSEVLVLTNARLRKHPNIVELLFYDFVAEGDHSAVPVLIVERADFQSLDKFLTQEHALSDLERLVLCADFTAGLAALHAVEVVHGDVKPDNVLVFGSNVPNKRFRAKLSDFGSIIPFAALPLVSASPVRKFYFGTPIYNAPEVEKLQYQPLNDFRMFLRCDSYSLGLSICQTLDGSLEEELSRKDSGVLSHALQKAQASGFKPQIIAAYNQVFDHLLQTDPSNRCFELKEIQTILEHAYATLGTAQLYTGPLHSNKNVGRSDEEVAKSTEAMFGSASYFNYGWDDDIAIPEDSQGDILDGLVSLTKSKERKEAGHAYFEMAMAFAVGLGVSISVEKAVDAMTSAAQLGFVPAYAHIIAWRSVTNCGAEIDDDTMLDWLYEAASFGSFYAGETLQIIDPSEYELVRREFHKSGGYNQYFRGAVMQDFTNSTYLTNLVISKSAAQDIELYEAVSFSAAAYGDVQLLSLLLSKGVDPDLSNNHGESLLVVACKAGQLTTLEALVKAGASACMQDRDGNIVRESALYWLIAFDEPDMKRAAQLLSHAGAESTGADYMTWNHPSIDFPGRFPKACPLHVAVWFNSSEAVRQLCLHWPHHVNATPPNESLTPLEYALRLWRLEPARILIENGALTEPDVNRECLIDIGSMPNYEAWLAQSLYKAHGEDLPLACIELVKAKAPHLLDQPSEDGFTPLMEAAQNHNVRIVRYLLGAGCIASRETPPEFDGRTALNLLTENKLRYEPNDIVDVLLNAGADLFHRSCTGGKNLLHFAARDNNVWIAKRCLDLGIDTESQASSGETPLHVAALYGSVEVGRLLVSRGANLEAKHKRGTINVHNWCGLTPLAFAASKLRGRFIRMLLEQGSSLMARPDTKSTLLHLAAGEMDTQVLELLLDMPAFQTPEALDAKDLLHGATALHYCVDNFGQEAHAKLLVEAGADVNAVTSQGYPVLDIACEARVWLKDKLDRLFNSLHNFSEERDDGHETMASYKEYHEQEAEIREEIAEEVVGQEAIRASIGQEEWQRGADEVGSRSLQEMYAFGEFNDQLDILGAWRAVSNLRLQLEASGARLNQPNDIAAVEYGKLSFKSTQSETSDVL